MPEGVSYGLAMVPSSGGSATSDSVSVTTSFGDSAIGESTSDSYSMALGAMAFLGGDSSAPSCTIKQSTGTPAEGATVTFTANCSDDTELKEITLYTDESGTMTMATNYGSPVVASGTAQTVTFDWKNAAIAQDTTVTWKVIATDTSGNEGESTTLAFTVGAAPDTTPPEAGKPAAVPASPTEGAEVTVTSDLTDDKGLASADLLVNGNVEGVTEISGTSATAEFSWVAGEAGTYELTVSVTDAAGNTAESDALVVTVGAGTGNCDPDTRPNDIPGTCQDGLQTKTTYVCDASTNEWKAVEKMEQCTAAPSSIAFIAIGIVAAVIAAAAALYIVKFRKPTAKKKGKVPEPPVTFG
jgi:hypothetical protein